MTREEAIEMLKLLKPNMRFDDSGWLYTKQALEMAIKALSQEPCRKDCRLCKEFDECDNGKKGHENGTSIGYSIGECKDYQPRIDAEVAKGFLEAKKRIEPENSGLYDVAISALSQDPTFDDECQKDMDEAWEQIQKKRKRIPVTLDLTPCDDAISREAVLDTTICEGISCNECSFNEIDGEPGCLLHARIDELPSVTQKSGKWIPVSERLPEEYGEYLVTWKTNDSSTPFISVCEYETSYEYDVEKHRFNGEWLVDDYILVHSDYEVIAWMPLPEPYKAESEE